MSYQSRRRNVRSHRQAHTNTHITSVATKALAAYGAYKLASWAWSKVSPTKDSSKENTRNVCHSQYHPSPSSQRAFSRKRSLQLQKCSREMLATLSTFLNALRTSIESHTDFSQQTKLLKQMRRNQNGGNNTGGGSSDNTLTKEELWNDIKTKSITRMIATAYAHSILVLLLTVQIHLLGGRIFREQFRDDCMNSNKNSCGGAGPSDVPTEEETELKSGQESQEENHRANVPRNDPAPSSHKQVLLQTYEYFFQHGIENLVKDVQLIVEVHLSDWKVVQSTSESHHFANGKAANTGITNINLRQFESGLQRVRVLLDGGLSLENYIIGSENEISGSRSGLNSDDLEQVQLIVDETLDILESPVFDIAKKEVVDLTFEVLRKDGYAPLFASGDDDAEKKSETSQPLVNVVTKLKKVVLGFYHSHDAATEDKWIERPMSSYPNIYLYHLDRVNSVKELGDVSFN